MRINGKEISITSTKSLLKYRKELHELLKSRKGEYYKILAKEIWLSDLRYKFDMFFKVKLMKRLVMTEDELIELLNYIQSQKWYNYSIVPAREFENQLVNFDKGKNFYELEID